MPQDPDAIYDALLATPTGMAPAVTTAFVHQPGYSTITDSNDPLAKEDEGWVDHSDDPIGHREWRVERAARVRDNAGP